MNKDEQRRSWPARAGVSIKQTKFVHACLWRRLDRVVIRTIDFGMKGYENKHGHKRRSCKAAHIPNCVVSAPFSNGRRTEFSYAVIICHWREASKHKLWWHLSMLTKRTDILYCISDDSSASYEKSHTWVCRSMQQGGTSTVMARPLAAWNHWTGQRKEPTRSWEYQHNRSQQTFIFGHCWQYSDTMHYNAVGTPSVEQLSVQTIQTALLCLMEPGVACPSNYLDVGRLFERECAEWTTSSGHILPYWS